MRLIALVIAIIATLIGLVLSFENIVMVVPVVIFFKQTSMALLYPLAMMFFIGLIAGAFFVIGFSGKKKEKVEEYEYLDDL